MELKKIIFDAERMKYPNTGLFHFCKNLGSSLLKQCPKDKRLYLYQNYKNPSYFGEEEAYIKQRSYQKFLKPSYNNFDLWHSTFQLSSYLPTSKRIKIVSTVHDLNFLHEQKSEQKRKKFLNHLQRNLDRADEIVAISKFVKFEIEAYCNTGGRPVHVVYNGNNIDPSLLTKYDDKEAIIESDYIFTIGTINTKKNFHVLLYLLLGNNLKLVISGIVHEQDYANKIIQLAEKLGLSDRLIMTGPITEEEKYNYLKHCSLFAFPSIAEGFGLPVVEAMAFGKKVLLSKATSLPEIGGTEAFYLENMDEQYLEDFGRNSIGKILESENRENQIKDWVSQFSWDQAASDYWDIYNRLLIR